MALDEMNARPFTLRTFKTFATVLVCVLLAGCYQTSKEVITSAVADPLPYKSNKVSLQADGDMFLSNPTSKNTYPFRYVKPDDPDARTGTLRVMRVKGTIYAVQLKYDDEKSYDILFCKITSKHFGIVEPKSDEAVKALARRYKVNLTSDIGDDLSGDPQDILAFLKAHKTLEFQTPKETTSEQ